MELLTNGIFMSFIGYLILMVIIGFVFCKQNKSLNDYLLGGRGLGSWVTAISAQANTAFSAISSTCNSSIKPMEEFILIPL